MKSKDNQPADFASLSQRSLPSDSLPNNNAGRIFEDLVDTVQLLSTILDIDSIILIVSKAARRLTGADGASFILRDQEMCFYVDEDAIAPLWKGQRFPTDSCISGWVMNHHEPLAIPDISLDARIRIEVYRPTFVRSLAMVPIQAQSPAGAIGVYWATLHTPTEEQIRILEALAHSTAVAIQNVRVRQELEARFHQRTEELESAKEALRRESLIRQQMEVRITQLSLTDELTGLSNRRGFLLRAEQLLRTLNRLHSHGWLVYIDLDGLAQINQEKGLDAGDRLLRDAAKVLRETFRNSDIVARIGRHEFAVFAASKSIPAEEIESRIGANLLHHHRCFPDQSVLTMSIGVIRCDPASQFSLDEMIHQADAAMYIQKRKRREQLREASQT